MLYIFLCITDLLEPQRQTTSLRTCAPSEDSDQPAHWRSLIRIFSGCILNRQWCSSSSCGQRRLWSDCADAQSDLCLRLAYMSEDTFSHVVAHYICMISCFVIICLCIITIRHSYFLSFMFLYETSYYANWPFNFEDVQRVNCFCHVLPFLTLSLFHK